MVKQKVGHVVDPNTTTHFFAKRITEGTFILILTCAFFILLALITHHPDDPILFSHHESSTPVHNAGGLVGAFIATILSFCFGYLAYLLPLSFIFLAWLIIHDHRSLQVVNKSMLLLRSFGLIFLLFGGCGLLSILLKNSPSHIQPGGVLGQFIAHAFHLALNENGALLLLSAMLLVGLTWLTGLSWIRFIELVGYYTWVVLGLCKKVFIYLYEKINIQDVTSNVSIKPTTPKRKIEVKKKEKVPVLVPDTIVVEKKDKESRVSETPIFRGKLSGHLPNLELLEKGQPKDPMSGYSHEELETLSRDVEQHLLDFGIQADVVAVHPGPVITRFELQLAAGLR